MTLEDTGERLLPQNDTSLTYLEHIQRYNFASQFVKGKSVLDIACGEGYGSSLLLSSGAKQVFGIDNNQQSIRHATKKYPRVKFLQDNAETVKKLHRRKFDIIVSFETIEHLNNPEKYLASMKMHLKQGGLLILSTPNAEIYARGNPFHIKEYYEEELNSLMKQFFKYATCLYQNTAGGPILHTAQHSVALPKLSIDLARPTYFVILASDTSIKKRNDVVADFSDISNEIQSYHATIREQQKAVSAMSHQLAMVRKEMHEVYTSKKFKLIESIAKTKQLTVKAVKEPKKAINVAKLLLTQGPAGVVRKLKQQQNIYDIDAQYAQWLTKHVPTAADLQQQRKTVKQFKYKPKVSIITPVFNTEINYLRQCITSVLNQTYPNWELCLVDDASDNPQVRETIQEYAKKDKRIKYLFRPKNGHIAEASNSAFSLATGEFTGILDHDDILHPHALYAVVSLLQKHKDADVIYSDEDKLEANGKRVAPFFKPDWSPDMLSSFNYLTHFTVIRSKLLKKAGKFRKGYEGSQDYDLFLRLEEITNKIYHIPDILYSWRKTPNSTASHYHHKTYAHQASIRALEDAYRRRQVNVLVSDGLIPGTFRVRRLLAKQPLISIIIPTKDKVDYLKRCILSVLSKTRYPNYELLIVDTGSTEKRTRDYYRTLQKNSRIRFLDWKKPFNYAAVNNFAVSHAKGDYLVLLNNDTEVISEEWLSAMLEHARRDEVGAVGAKLLYPNNTIQHAGVILGIIGGKLHKPVAGHSERNVPDDLPPYSTILNSKDIIRNFSAVTAACLMIKKSKYEEVNGIDEKFVIAFNDVDFCLKLRKAGYLNVYTPYAKLYHHESVSVAKPGEQGRDLALLDKEVDIMHEKWGDILLNDPYFSKNYSTESEQYLLAA